MIPHDSARPGQIGRVPGKVALHLAEAIEAEDRRQAHRGRFGIPEPHGNPGGRPEGGPFGMGTKLIHRFLSAGRERREACQERGLGTGHVSLQNLQQLLPHFLYYAVAACIASPGSRNDLASKPGRDLGVCPGGFS